MSTGTTKADAVYWAAKPPLEFAKEFFARLGLQTQGAAYGYLGRLQLLAHRHYYGSLPSGYVGDMPSSGEVTRSGEQGANVDLRVNWLRNNANARHQVVTAAELAWGCTPVNTDARSLADAARGAEILEYEWKATDAATQAIQAVLGAILYGEEFLFSYWNPVGGAPVTRDPQTVRVVYTGSLDLINVPAWDCLRDTSSKSYEASDWIDVRVPLNRYDLIAQFPDQAAEILAAASPPLTNQSGIAGVSLTTTTNLDKVLVHFFFHKRKPCVPMGLQAIMLNEQCVLAFDDLEDCYAAPNPLPVARCQDFDLKGTPFGYASLWEAMATQDLVTDIQGSLATNIVTFGKQMISAEADTDLPIYQMGNGPAVITRPKGTPPPEALQLTASPPEAFKHLDRLKTDMRTAFGLNDLSFGEAPTGAPNAEAWALLSSAAVTANSGLQRNYVKCVTNVGKSRLAIIKAKMQHKQKVAIIGRHGPSMPQQDEYDGSDFNGVSDVLVGIDNPLSQTAAGRLQIAQLYSKNNFVTTPEQLEAVVTTGKLEPLTQVLRDELIYIAAENEDILDGKSPPVKITDSHQLHIREHRGPTFSAESRMNPQINIAADEHIKEHLRLLMTTDPRILAVLGQAAPPPAPAPAPTGQSSFPAQAAVNKAVPALASPMENQQQRTAETKTPSLPDILNPKGVANAA